MTVELKRHVLGMLGGAAPPSLAFGQWQVIGEMAEQHRLQPLLAWRLEQATNEWNVPPAIASTWRNARQAAGLLALPQLACLRLVGARLDEAGIAFMVLKGPRLAYACYPEAGLRPMRDLDVLVAPQDVMRAAEVLAAAGFMAEENAAVLAEAVAHAKHLPAMFHAELGVAVELHHRLSEPPHRDAHRSPQIDPAAALARRELTVLAGAAVPVQPAADLLAHIMIHALYGHRLDCGPLVLSDIHYLLATRPIAADTLGALAEKGGWLRGAELLLALTSRYFGPQPLSLQTAPPENVLAAAEEALLQDLSTRGHAILMSDLMAARSAAAWAGTLARRLRPRAHVLAAEGGGATAWRFWPIWATRRLGAVARGIATRRTSREASQSAALLRWLQG